VKSPFRSFDGFEYSAAIPFEEGVTRRDPSPVILVDDEYFVWYSRTPHTQSGYTASIWYATSTDGHAWVERGEALPKGDAGSFDEHAVFTPTILCANGMYHLFYTAVPKPFDEHTRTAIGVASAHSPHGPWARSDGNPVLRPSDDPDEFDSMRIDDTCIIVRGDEYWMYYKGRQLDHTPRETKMGVSIAREPTGPYEKHAGNPVLDSGHEVCVWPHGVGVGCLVSDVGPQGNSLQYSDDGVHFRKVADTVPPQAPGPFRADGFASESGPGVTWGICMKLDREWPYLARFDCRLVP
jgi:beta-xylosidase